MPTASTDAAPSVMWIGLSVFAISSTGRNVRTTVRIRIGSAPGAPGRRMSTLPVRSIWFWFWLTSALLDVIVIGGCSSVRLCTTGLSMSAVLSAGRCVRRSPEIT
jgi:hypothetical protein